MSLRTRAKIASLTDPSLRLAFAVEKNNADAIQHELRNGADPNFQTLEGATMLMAAIANGYHDAAKALLEGGADPNRVSQFGNTAMDLAADATDADSVVMLLDYGALPSEKLSRRRAQTPDSDDKSDAALVEELTEALEKESGAIQAVEARLAEARERTNVAAEAHASALKCEAGERARVEKELLDERDQRGALAKAQSKQLERQAAARVRLEENLAALRDRLTAMETQHGEALQTEVAAREAAEKELRETKAALEAALGAKAQFLATMRQQIQNLQSADGDGIVVPESNVEDLGDNAKVRRCIAQAAASEPCAVATVRLSALRHPENVPPVPLIVIRDEFG